MGISRDEFKKEEIILSKVKDLLGETLESLGGEVYQDEEDFTEFKKMMWSDASSFDDGEAQQVMAATSQEAEKILQKRTYFKRLNQIKNKPYFASIVFKDEYGKIWNIYISLTYLKDDDFNNILYDWRSPICSLFYDYEIGPCSYQAPGGKYFGELKRKRQYKIEDCKLLGVFDNSLNIDDEVLQDVLAKESSEKMKNVVNTIQQEQNQVIRNLEDHNLIVQGIAGSGKTTVALHRIAFLLYRIPNLSSNHILIFSPNPIFTEYISDVLPSLGENNTLQTTFNDYLSFFINEYKEIESFADFVGRYYSGEVCNSDLIRYKQSDEIIGDIDLYLKDYVDNAEFIESFYESEIHYVDRDEINHLLHYKYDRLPLFERVEEIAKRLSSTFYKGSGKKNGTFRKLLKEHANFKKDFKEIYRGFYYSPYCKITLSDSEIDKFMKRKVLYYEDALLLSYIKGILNGFPYEQQIKHVVIDEAQDYNKLQYIIISKIFARSDFTILGDVNQNINPYYHYDSLSSLASILKNDSKYIELLKTYRSSPEIINYTNKILNLNHVNAIRRDNNKPVIFRRNISNLKEQLLNDINSLKSEYASIAIITKDDLEAQKLYNLLKDEVNISYLSLETKGFSKELLLVPAYLAKGLEFDSVILYNDRNNSYKSNERNLLYVACTRAQHELYIYN